LWNPDGSKVYTETGIAYPDGNGTIVYTVTCHTGYTDGGICLDDYFLPLDTATAYEDGSFACGSHKSSGTSENIPCTGGGADFTHRVGLFILVLNGSPARIHSYLTARLAKD
jgi:hypothetical protein